ncbi:MAG: NADH-quinone oxidoreductase subunit N [Bacteroidales bacterium]|nr:NADH-quinone oxidoreductase subunit N [Bacteroidales bacterium]MBR6310157.1 NADH-quinone oxidoreductase subunit N [Paludibacteraceae bacterium]MDD6357365.1 NADH-quinone oxidoreductase subunit N [Bacteroidales bacterium]
MDLSNYLLLRQEMSLLVVFLILMIYDLFAGEKGKKGFHLIACTLWGLHTICGFLFPVSGSSFAGMYVNNDVETIVKNILNIGVFIIFLQSYGWLKKSDTIFKRGEFFMLVLLTLFGMYMMISARNFILFFIGLETASLPIASLVAFDKYTHHSAEAGAKFILTAVFSSVIMLFGLSMLYGNCGTLYFEDIATTIIAPSAIVILALTFVLTGLFFKLSLVPFHLWTADVYEGAPTNVTSYLSTISKGAAVYALMVILYRVFGNLFFEWNAMLWWIILITITIGNIFAIRQNNFKRFLAFSSISQAGYIILSVFIGTAQGMGATIYYILVYVVSNLAAFGVANAIETQTGKINISDYNGLYKTNPNLSIILMLAMFSLGGIPPTAGFFSKFFVFTAVAEQQEYLLLFIALLNTVISLYYYLLVVKAIFINPNETPIEKLTTDNYTKVSFAICLIGIFAIGFASCIYEYLNGVSFGL